MTAFGFSLLAMGMIVLLAEARRPWLAIFDGPGVVALAAGSVLAASGLGAGLGWAIVAATVITGSAVAPRRWATERAGTD